MKNQQNVIFSEMISSSDSVCSFNSYFDWRGGEGRGGEGRGVAHGADLVLLPPLLLLTTRAVSAQLVLRQGTGGDSHSQHTYTQWTYVHIPNTVSHSIGGTFSYTVYLCV